MKTVTGIKKTSLIITAPICTEYESILTNDALCFIEKLELKFRKTRQRLLANREEVQSKIDLGETPNFLPETEKIRLKDWKINPIPKDLLDRRVEITGPIDRKMIINALNSDVKVFMADFEDSNSPTWENIISGQINLRDAINKTITFTNPYNDKLYHLNDKTATLMVRPRGWHLHEKNVTLNGMPISASIFDFGLFFYHNAKQQIINKTAPYFYLPKLEHYNEAKLWNDIFIMAQNDFDIPIGTIKATVLIETILAAFQMDEILYALKEHSAGLNCGRWDYIFSFIKKFKNNFDFVLPDRSEVTMESHFLKSYVKLLIHTCHKRGAHAMGGMAAQIPIKNDKEANIIALNKVKNDKKREAEAGHDGTWIAHPGLAPIATEAFNKVMKGPNQLKKNIGLCEISHKDLLKVPIGSITEDGARENIRIGVQYLEAWLNGNGCVPLYNLMEDAATAEISRSQLWQWLKHKKTLSNGIKITSEYYKKIMKEELNIIKKQFGEEIFSSKNFNQASAMFLNMITAEKLDEFLTLPAYKNI
jgi:malate synthase